ncbi:MAG: GNAT family N-acetyltransferase [Promethearchaeota archaeon]
MNSGKDTKQFSITKDPSDKEIKVVKQGLDEHNKAHPHGKLDIPPPDISLVLRDKNGIIIGGVITSMLTGVMHLEVLWVSKQHRRQGLGKALVLASEKIGKEKGYPSS